LYSVTSEALGNIETRKSHYR